MASDNPPVANFIIGGTEKAGTTSVFMYLGEHPQVCCASSKETDFFRQELTGDPAMDRLSYARYFSHCKESVPVVMEASPGYLGESASVVPRMASLLQDVKLLFILRDPIERLYSSYNFHVGKLDIPEDVDFQSYVEKCLAYDRGEKMAKDLGLGEWYLKTMRFGCYADFLVPYLDAFPRASIKVMFFEHLRDDVSGFMRELSAFLGIDTGFWSQYEFKKANVTFSGRAKMLHKAAIYINNKSEPFLRRRPWLKRFIVNCYKMINQAREGYDPMPVQVRRQLENYYHPCNQALRNMLGEEIPKSWGAHVQSADSTV